MIMEKKYAIKVISSSCGIMPHTLRIWEKRYQVFEPERSDGGQRLYSEEDLKKAKLLAKLIEHGHSISSIANFTLEELEFMVSSFTEQARENKQHASSINSKKLIEHIHQYEIEKASEELQHLRMSVGAKEFIFEVIIPTVQKIGVMVTKGEYSVTQEHIFSTIIRDQLGQIFLPNLGNGHDKVCLATPEGNLHELAIIIADILCRANRVSTHYLGAAHPADCLAEAMNLLNCKYLVLGVLSSDQWDYQKQIIKYLKKTDSKLKNPVTVLLGGGYSLEFPKYKMIKEIIILESFEKFDQILLEKF
jgi:MerR family transcriptional regulator, light-induced transcriptional regulator